MTRHETATRKIQTTIWMKNNSPRENNTSIENQQHQQHHHQLLLLLLLVLLLLYQTRHRNSCYCYCTATLTTTHPCHAKPSCCMSPLRHHLSSHCVPKSHTPSVKKDTSTRKHKWKDTNSPMNASLTFFTTTMIRTKDKTITICMRKKKALVKANTVVVVVVVVEGGVL